MPKIRGQKSEDRGQKTKARKRAPKSQGSAEGETPSPDRDEPSQSQQPAPEVKEELNKIAETAREIANITGTGPTPAEPRDPSEPPVPQPIQVQDRLEAEAKNEKPPVHKKAHKEATVTAEDKQWIKEREDRRKETASPGPVHWADLPSAPKDEVLKRPGSAVPAITTGAATAQWKSAGTADATKRAGATTRGTKKKP